jgi:hypothetical protein
MVKLKLSEFTKGRPTTPEIDVNIANTISKIEMFLQSYTGEVIISSGLRDPGSNRAAGGAIKSTHLTGEAIDIVDRDGKVWQYVLENLHFAQQIGLWFEDKRWTPTWVHIQTVPPKSLKRIYIPNTNPPLAPNAWNGEYSKSFDK